MSKWGDRLTELREMKGVQQKDIADKMGIDYTAYNRYERNKTQNISRTLEKRLLKVFTLEELEYIKSGGEKPVEQDIVFDVPLAYGTSSPEGMVNIPYHASVYASAGGGSDATSMVESSPVTFSRGFLNSFLGIYNVNGLSIINAAGDSMSPTIKSGELMFVYPIENEGFKDGGIYVLMCGDALLVKRVWLNPITHEYTLKSDSVEVAPIVMKVDESSDCHFVGRVVGHLDRV